jgi:hypothetical protein
VCSLAYSVTANMRRHAGIAMAFGQRQSVVTMWSELAKFFQMALSLRNGWRRLQTALWNRVCTATVQVKRRLHPAERVDCSAYFAATNGEIDFFVPSACWSVQRLTCLGAIEGGRCPGQGRSRPLLCAVQNDSHALAVNGRDG